MAYYKQDADPSALRAPRMPRQRFALRFQDEAGHARRKDFRRLDQALREQRRRGGRLSVEDEKR